MLHLFKKHKKKRSSLSTDDTQSIDRRASFVSSQDAQATSTLQTSRRGSPSRSSSSTKGRPSAPEISYSTSSAPVLQSRPSTQSLKKPVSASRSPLAPTEPKLPVPSLSLEISPASTSAAGPPSIQQLPIRSPPLGVPQSARLRKLSVSSNISTQSSCSYTTAPVCRPSIMAVRPSSSRQMNGSSVLSPIESPGALFRAKGRLSSFASSRATSGNFSGLKSPKKRVNTGNYQNLFVQESASALAERSKKALGVAHEGISDVTYVSFLEWIRSERLTTLPHKGSRWDRVLIRALYFAEQLHKFEQAIQPFAHNSSSAATVGYGHAQLLLELSHHNSEALDKAFSIFYKFAMSFHAVLHRSELLAASPEIREQICLLYADLISLVVDVSIQFYYAAKGMSSGSTSLDIFEQFGDTIESFRTRQNSVIELIWQSQIENEVFEEGESIDVQHLSRWLASQDRVIAAITRDHETYVDNQAEFTCLWFNKHLTRFFQSQNRIFLVTGQSGAGKTTLAGSIVERLQRPMNRQQYDTLFCSLSPDIPTAATSLAVVKSLLFQLLNLRVGNMNMYWALFRAYSQCRNSEDVKAYEEYLWQALTEALQHPAAGSNELVIVVDGLDEIAESKSASIQAMGGFSSSGLLEKLAKVTKQGRGVRLITMSSSVKLSSPSMGIQHEITHDDVRDDLHAVALRALMHNHHFHSQRALEQEQLLDRIIQASTGSFLRVTLICELLNAQKSPDALAKTMDGFESSKPSVSDLIVSLIKQLNPNNDAKTMLAWVLAAERPLTMDEIHTLFSVDVHHGTVSDKGINVNAMFRSLEPLFTLHQRIVRFKHPVIHSTLHDLATSGKVPIPLQDSETDLLLRVLAYTKSVLKDSKSEPTFEISNPSTTDKLFKQHRFLEYAVRYWVLHLQQSPLAPKESGEFKPSGELKKVFPDTTMLSILESNCWNLQLPIPQVLDLQRLVSKVRETLFTKNHPAVLQTYLSIATCYMMVSNTTQIAKYLYTCTIISKETLSPIHPLTIECATQFLSVTETQTSSSRTEIMTHREQILMVLITAYETQYGSSSELVIKTRQQLQQLYESINETENALKISKLIQIHESGSSHSNNDYWETGGVVINQLHQHDHADVHSSILGGDEMEEESTSIMTISSIEAQLSVIQQHLHRKEFQQAERLYVELWMEVSSKCRTVMSTEWHEKNIEIATSYSQFLKNQKRTSESTAVLSSVWQQYESHQLSYSESIVSRLTRVAKEMRSMNAHAQALSIFKFASSYYHSVNRQETKESREIIEELSQTSSELIQHSLSSSSSVMQTTTTTSASVFHDVFFTTISSSQTVDSSTIALSKKLTAQHMAKSHYTAAINVIHATLERTWSSFLANSIHDVAMATSFVQESVELIERLAECYLQMRQLDKVDDVYNRFFRAVLVTEKVDQAIFEKAKNLLINFYDKHGYVDKAISVFQEILVVYRARFGHTHEKTIQTLYILAQRCRAHPRNHGYWLDYYLQILVALNKESDICHKNALDALQVVTVTYWEDRRYAEAVTFYRVLWNTFVRQNKEHKIFVDAKFVETLYERYYQCLEETKATWSDMYKVTKEYRETSTAVFGAESTIAVNATLSLAQVAQSSEQHMSEAISLYEAVSQSGQQVTTTTTVTEINNALSSLYLKQMHSSSSSSMKSETISRALAISESHFHEATQQYGYSHESSLTSLKELATLYSRQQKTDVAIKQISKTVSEIVSKETSSQKQMESAASIASTLQIIGQSSTAHSMVQELHRQICAKDSRYASKWSFDLTKTGRTSLAFLASLQYHLRKDLSITFSEIYADLTMEYLYWVQFHHTLQNNESLTNILLAAAPLRYYLRRNDNKDMISVVEDQAVDLFVKRDAQDLKEFSKESPRIFIIGILDYLGSGRNKDFIRSVILSSNRSVSQLTREKKFREAYDIANLGFLFASKHDGYNGPRAIGMGFKLASLLVGRDSNEKCPDAALRKKMLALSNRIVKRILDICKSLKINFAHIQLYELSQLSALLGEQEDYETLEWLLTTLWQTRDAQRSWPAEVLLNLGRRLICARYLGGQPVKAIRLAEDIAYNMRRAHGPRAPITIETYELLAQLYTSTGQQYQAQAAKGEKTASMAQDYFKKAILVHEDILRILVNTSSNGSGAADNDDDDDDEMDTTAQLLAREGVNVKSAPNTPSPDAIDSNTIDLAATALKHLHLLKLAYQRYGGWPKSYNEYERLNALLFRVFGTDPKWKGAEGTEKWDAKAFGAGKAESQEGGFKGVEDWTFGSDKLVMGQHQHPHQHVQVHSPRPNGLAIRGA